MAVVANAGPLIALARIGYLNLLPALFGEVIIPRAVYQEITTETSLPGAQDMLEARWLQVRNIGDRLAVQRLLFWLDHGESEAIVLAREIGVTLLIDERRGRAIATTLGLNITGTVGILLAAKTKGQVTAVTPLLNALLAAGIRLSTRLYQEARRMAGE